MIWTDQICSSGKYARIKLSLNSTILGKKFPFLEKNSDF